MAATGILRVIDDDFDQVVLSDPSPVMVEFYAPWCPHCGRLAPVIEGLARDYGGRLRVVQVDASQSTQVPTRFQIMGVPTMIIFVNGQEVDRIVGAVPRETLESHVGAALAKAQPIPAAR